MILSILTLFVALSISIVAAFYSIIGLTTIFPTAMVSIIIMGVVLEAGKIMTAIWLHNFWQKAGILIKTYLISALLVLMLITSMGIFGFLSNAHIEQTAGSGTNIILIQNFDRHISQQQKIISDAELVISQLDQAVQVLLDADRIRGNDGAIAVRNNQLPERESLNNIIIHANEKITELINEKNVLEIEQSKIQAELGPLRYVAELLYGDNIDENIIEKSVKWLILLIVFVFDPLAIVLIIAAIHSIRLHKLPTEKVNKKIETYSPPTETTPDPIKTKIDQASGWLGEK